MLRHQRRGEDAVDWNLRVLRLQRCLETRLERRSLLLDERELSWLVYHGDGELHVVLRALHLRELSSRLWHHGLLLIHGHPRVLSCE